MAQAVDQFGLLDAQRAGDAAGGGEVGVQFRAVHGLGEARAVPGVESVEISAPLHYPLVPLPEGDSYLGFIFARAGDPAAVEAALREAHARLRFEILPNIPII